MIKLQQQIVMQSGTVLHLALLKKLSNHYPNGELSSRFSQFKQSSANKCSPRTPTSYHHLSVEKYQHTQFKQQFKNTIKPRRKRLEQKYKRLVENHDLNESVTGWKVENQYQVNYTEKLKRDKYDFFPRLKDSSFKLKEKEMSSEILRVKQEYNFVVENLQTQKNVIRFKSKEKKSNPKNKSFLVLEQKENENFHPTPTCKLKNRRTKSNDRSITASPLVKRFKFQFQ